MAPLLKPLQNCSILTMQAKPINFTMRSRAINQCRRDQLTHRSNKTKFLTVTSHQSYDQKNRSKSSELFFFFFFTTTSLYSRTSTCFSHASPGRPKYRCARRLDYTFYCDIFDAENQEIASKVCWCEIVEKIKSFWSKVQSHKIKTRIELKLIKVKLNKTKKKMFNSLY